MRIDEEGYIKTIPQRTALRIVPDENGKRVQHQYECVYCSQLVVEKARVEEVPKELGEKCYNLLAKCEHASPDEFNAATGLAAIATFEGLAILNDGSYIAVENCD